MNNIMLDLETLGNRETAAILSIGAVRFDWGQNKTGSEFYTLVDVEDCTRYGLTMDVSTIKWWMLQSDAARAIFNNRAPLLREALAEFTRFVNEIPGSVIWGNGATFDNMIIRNAYRQSAMVIPWSYRDDLCYRTLRRICPIKYNEPKVPHNALEDARAQALTAIAIMRKLEGLG